MYIRALMVIRQARRAVAERYLFVLSFAAVMTIALQTVEFIDVWSPIGDDYALMERAGSLEPTGLFVSSWHGLFDAGGVNRTVRSDVYRPLLDLSIRFDLALAQRFGPRLMIFTSLGVLLLLTIAVSGVARELTSSRKIAAAVGILFTLHACRSDAYVSLANRSDPMVALFLVVGFWGLLLYARGRHPLWRVVPHVSLLLALLAKEMAVVGLLIPVVVVAVEWRKPTSRYSMRTAAVDILIMAGMIALYIGWRWVLFGGIGEYGGQALDVARMVKNVALIFYYLMFGNEYDIDSSLRHVLLVLPLLGFIALLVVKGNVRPLHTAAVLALVAALAAPAIPYISGKRLMVLPLVAVVLAGALLYRHLRSRSDRMFLTACVLLAAIAQILQWNAIGREFRCVFEMKARYDRQLSTMNVGSDTICAILPYTMGANAWLFSNGIECYLRRFDGFGRATIVPIGFISRKDRGEGCRLDVTLRGREITIRSREPWSLRLPGLVTDMEGFRSSSFAVDRISDTVLPLRALQYVVPFRRYRFIYPDGDSLRMIAAGMVPFIAAAPSALRPPLAPAAR